MNKFQEVKIDYEARYASLQMVASSLQNYIRNLLHGAAHVDAVSARAKAPERYVAKALKLKDNGQYKYQEPRYEIQDQVGARVTVFYLKDVENIRQIIRSNLRFIEDNAKEPEDPSEFGYFGRHFIISLPEEVIPDITQSDDVPEFFELQIKTLFQHAWSEASHDLGYKPDRQLTALEVRTMAFTAAQAWGADQMFDSLIEDSIVNDN